MRAAAGSDHVGALRAAWDRHRPALVVGALVVAASLATRLPFFFRSFVNVDEAAHLLGADALRDGARLYVDFADNKPPLVYAVYAAAQWLFGPGLTSVRLASAIVVVPAIALAAAAVFDFDRRGLAASLGFVVASATMLASDAHALHCEHVMLVPLAWSLVLLRSARALTRWRRLLVAGLLVGIATMGKQPAALCLIAYAASAWTSGDRHSVSSRLRGIAALLAGFTLAMAGGFAWLARHSSLGEAVFWIWEYNAAHVTNPMTAPQALDRIVQFGLVLSPAMLPWALASVWGWSRWSVGSPTDGAPRVSSSSLSPALWARFAVAVTLPAFLGLRMFGHYFLPAVLALCISAAPFIASMGGSRRRALLSVGALGFVTMTALGLVVHEPGRGIADVSRSVYSRIGAHVRADTPPDDRALFVWGYAPTIYVHADAVPASRFVVPIDTVSGYVAGNDAVLDGRLDTRERIDESHWDALMADLERSRPLHIVDTAPGDLNHWGRFGLSQFPRLAAFVERGYRREAVIGGAVIYVRQGATRRPQPHRGGEQHSSLGRAATREQRPRSPSPAPDHDRQVALCPRPRAHHGAGARGLSARGGARRS